MILLLFNHFYPTSSKEEESDELLYTWFGHSLWSAQPVASAMRLKEEERVSQMFLSYRLLSQRLVIETNLFHTPDVTSVQY